MDPVRDAEESRMPLCIHDLPPEILLLVLGHFSSFDLDSFASTCKRWRAVAAKRLVEHDRLKKKYTKVELVQHRRSSKHYYSPGRLLRELHKKPELGFYPRYVSLTEGLALHYFHSGYRYEFYRSIYENIRYRGNTYELFRDTDENTRQTVNALRCIVKTYSSHQNGNHLWWRGSGSDFPTEPTEDSDLAFCLTFLPNLRELRVPRSSNLLPGSTLVLQVFTTASTAKVREINVLARFQMVKIAMSTDRSRRLGFSYDTPPGCRHSLSFIMGRNCFDDLWGDYVSPKLEGINVKASGDGDPNLRPLLEFQSVLRVVRYIHTCKSPAVIHPHSISSALMKFNHTTLQELCLGMSEGVKVAKPVGSLQGFLVLKRLEIDPDLFVCPSSGRVAKLIDVLPPSIEVVGLREPGKFVEVLGLRGLKKVRAAEAIFHGLRVKNKRLLTPKMRTLELAMPQDRWDSISGTLWALAEKMGWDFGYFKRKFVVYSG
ncbi:hypothetical protein MMC30_008118 [Trapelia coarctata]|nr:hypothetical protein [Trapelia coarctata]